MLCYTKFTLVRRIRMIPIFIMALDDRDERQFMIDLYLELKPYMHQRAYSIVKDYSLAEDMVHDAFAKLIPRIPELTNMSKNQLASYVGHTVINTSLNYFNRHKSSRCKELLTDDDTTFEMPDLSITIEEKIEIDETKEGLAQLLEQLPDRDRNLIYCKYYMEMSDQEIADTLGIKPSNVRVYISRVRQRMKKLLKTEGAKFLYEEFMEQ